MPHINKLIGYGIQNLQSSGNQFTDPRLDLSGFVFSKNQEDEYHVRNFYIELHKQKEYWKIPIYAMEHFQPYIYDCVHLLPKDGIIAIVPPDKAFVWYRKDDIIDAVIDTEFFNKFTSCAVLSNNIPPFCEFMDVRTGDQLDHEEVGIFRDKYEKMKEVGDNEKARNQLGISVYESAKRMGFKSIEEANKSIVPSLPDILVRFVHWLKIFKEKEMMLEMRPITLSYWK